MTKKEIQNIQYLLQAYQEELGMLEVEIGIENPDFDDEEIYREAVYRLLIEYGIPEWDAIRYVRRYL